MSEDTPEPTHRPKDDAAPQPLEYFLQVGFIPPIAMLKKAGLEFVASLSDYLDPQNVELESNSWSFEGGVASEGIKVNIKAGSISMSVLRPTRDPVERYETKYQIVLSHFKEKFHPQVLFNARARVRLLFPIDGDARFFLGSDVMRVDPARVNAVGRPIHLIGLRMFFPPFELEEGGNGGIDWGVNVKAESSMIDTSKLWLEAEAKWEDPRDWSESESEALVGHLTTVSDFLIDRVIPFLKEGPNDDHDAE